MTEQLQHLNLRNFMGFNNLTLDFSPKINVLIGENGTGKTHLLKAAYGLCAGAPLFKNKPGTSDDELEAALTAKLLRLFMPLDDKLGKMHRHSATDQASNQDPLGELLEVAGVWSRAGFSRHGDPPAPAAPRRS